MTKFDSRQNLRLHFQTICQQQKEYHTSPALQKERTEGGSGKMEGSVEVPKVSGEPHSSTLSNSTNQARIEAFSNAVMEIFGDVLDPRFYGNVTFHFTVQGGIIQTIRSGVERSIR